jgi:hypothetical protein
MVKCHNHHRDAANDVNGFDSAFSKRGGHGVARKCFWEIISSTHYPLCWGKFNELVNHELSYLFPDSNILQKIRFKHGCW